MEDRRDQSGKTVLKKPTSRRFGMPAAMTAVLALALIFFGLSLALPTLLSSNYYQKSLKLLRAQAESIKKEYAGLLRDQREKQQRLAQSPFPEKSELWFEKFRRLNLNPEVEGVAAYTSQGKLTIWLGNVLNLEDVFQDWESVPFFQGAAGSFLIKDKASSYLVSVQKVRRTEYIALYRLLAFIPQFKSPYLSEYYFLRSRLRKNCVIENWDFREDISGTENFFSRHQDEYIGSRELQREDPNLLFSPPQRAAKDRRHRDLEVAVSFHLPPGLERALAACLLSSRSGSARPPPDPSRPPSRFLRASKNRPRPSPPSRPGRTALHLLSFEPPRKRPVAPALLADALGIPFRGRFHEIPGRYIFDLPLPFSIAGRHRLLHARAS